MINAQSVTLNQRLTMAGKSQGDSPKRSSRSDGSLDGTMSVSQEELIDEFTVLPTITEQIARDLIGEGFEALDDLYKADIKKLAAVRGLDEKKADQIKTEIEKRAKEKGFSSVDEGKKDEDELAQWLTGKSDKDLGGVLSKENEQNEELSPAREDSTESLKAWLSGEEDSFKDWLGQESFEEEKEEIEERLKEKERELEEKEKELNQKEEKLEELSSKFQKHVEDLEMEKFDPEEMIEKNSELSRDLEKKEEKIEKLREEKSELEDEIAEIKKGSVAMVKYLKSEQSQTPAPPDESEGKVSEKKLQALKNENEKLKKRIDELESREEVSGIDDEEIKKKLEERDEEIRELRKELDHKEDQIEKLKEQVGQKEQELNEREEDLQHREKVLRKERQKLESMKKEMENKTEQERKRELEELKKEIEKKEQDLKAKEKYIDQKEKELKAREDELIDEELEERQEEILQEIEQEKCKTGTGRLDDLLLGGIPLGSNVSIYGPPHVGKEVMVNSFIAEGLEKGVPAIWVITDKTIEDIREEMKFVLPTYEEYEIRGLVYYVDAYSSSMGEVEESEREKDHIKYIEEQSDVRAITEAVNEFAEKINQENRYYRMAFESVSTIIAYLDTETTFRILQPFTGRRKKENAVSLYTLEKGMHTDQDISMLGHIMNGEIEFKVEQLKNYLRVEGLGDVQTRDWIEYTQSKSGISMGSFSLDTIR